MQGSLALYSGEAWNGMTLVHSPLARTKLYNLHGKNGVNY